MAPYSSFGGFPDEGGSEAFLRRALTGCDLPVFLYSSPGEARKKAWFVGEGVYSIGEMYSISCMVVVV